MSTSSKSIRDIVNKKISLHNGVRNIQRYTATNSFEFLLRKKNRRITVIHDSPNPNKAIEQLTEKIQRPTINC